MAEQLSMFEPPKRKSGLLYLPKYLMIADQKDLLNDLRTVVRQSPLFTPSMSSGAPFRYKMTNIGDLGWNSDRKGYRYESKHPVTGQPYPEIPSSLRSMIDDLSGKFGEKIRPDAVLLNWYSNGAKLGLHVDSTEKVSKPVVSLSLGDRGVFAIDTTGSRDRSTAMRNLERINVNSGDAIVFGGDLRNAYHAVERIDAGTAPTELGMKNSGRINLTARQVNETGIKYMAANKKIETSISTTVSESTGKPPKLTSDIIADYLDRMGGQATLVKPDGSQYNPDRKGRVNIGDRMTLAEKFGQAGDVGLNNDFMKLPEVHARFDDRMTALQVQKEIATGRLTTQKFFEVPTKEIANQAADEIRRSPELLGRGETLEVRPSKGGFEVVAVKQYQPIPSRGNTLARTYNLNNDATGTFVAFNKPEESYSAPKSLKELQADTRKAYQTFGLKPNASIAELEAAVQPIVGDVKSNPQLRDRLSTVLTDIQNRSTPEPVVPERGWDKIPARSPMTEQLTEQFKAIAPESQQLLNTARSTGGYPNAVGEPFNPPRTDVKPIEIKQPRFAAEMGIATNPTGLSDRGYYNKVASTYADDNFGLGDRLKSFPDFYDLQRQAKAEGVRPEAFQNYIKGKAEAPLIESGIMKTPELPLTARLGQEYISPKSGNVGTVESVGKKGVKLNVDGQVVPVEYKTLERLKYTGNKGYGFARIPALAAVTTTGLGAAAGVASGRALARVLGMDEDQQNIAGVIGGVTGGLTGAIAPASLDYKLAGMAQPEFKFGDMRLPTPQEVGKTLFMRERNPELGMFRMDAIAPDVRAKIDSLIEYSLPSGILAYDEQGSTTGINALLRDQATGMDSHVSDFKTFENQAFVRALQDDLQSVPTKPQITYRGMVENATDFRSGYKGSGGSGERLAESIGLRPDRTFYDKAFMATTPNRDYADRYGKDITLEVMGSAGYKMPTRHADMGGEVLYPAGNQFDVENYRLDGKKVTARLIDRNLAPDEVASLKQSLLKRSPINDPRLNEIADYHRQFDSLENKRLGSQFYGQILEQEKIAADAKAKFDRGELGKTLYESIDRGSRSKMWDISQAFDQRFPYAPFPLSDIAGYRTQVEPLFTKEARQARRSPDHTGKFQESAIANPNQFEYGQKFQSPRTGASGSLVSVDGQNAVLQNIDGKQKTVPISVLKDDLQIKAPATLTDLKRGDGLIANKSDQRYTVMATTPDAVKLRGEDGNIKTARKSQVPELFRPNSLGFAVPVALRPVIGGFAGGTLGAIAFKQLAKAAGLNEDQQNIAAGVGGVTGALTGGSLSLFKPTTELKVPTAQQFARNVMGIPAPSQSGMFLSAEGRNKMRLNQLNQYDVKPVLGEAAVIATDLLTPHPYGIATVPAARMATDSWKNNYDAIAERGLAAMKTTASGATSAIKDFTYQTLSQLGRSVGLPFPMTEQSVGQVLDAIPNAQQVMSMADRAKARLSRRYGGESGMVMMGDRQSTGAIFQVEPKSLSELQKQRAKLDTYNPDAKPIQAVKEFKPVPKLSLEEAAALQGMKPNEYKGFQEKVYQETEFLNSKPYQEASERIAQQQFKQQQTYFDAMKAWNKANDPTIPMPRKEDFAQPIKRTFDIQSTLSEASLRAKQSTTRSSESVGFGKTKPKSAIAQATQAIQNVGEMALDAIYQPSRANPSRVSSQPKQSNFIAESAVEAAAKSTGATTAQVKAQIANQRSTGAAPDLAKATEAIAVQQSKQLATRNQPSQSKELATRSLKELQSKELSTRVLSRQQPDGMIATPSESMIKAGLKQQSRIKIGDRIGASGLGIFMDTAQAAQVLTEAASRGENAPTALTRAGVSVGAGYAATGLASFIPNPYLRTAAQLVGGIAAVVGADKLVDQVVGRDDAKEQKFSKDLSKLDLQPTNQSQQWKPFANDSNLLAAYGNSFSSQIQGNLDYRPAARSLANLTNSQSIENARYASERNTSLQAGMDAKSQKPNTVYRDRGDGVTEGLGRRRGFSATESRVLALQNLANEHGYEVDRTGKFDPKLNEALDKLGYSDHQIGDYIQGKSGEAIGKPDGENYKQKIEDAKREEVNKRLRPAGTGLLADSGNKVTGSQLSAALSAERQKQGLKYGQSLDQGTVDSVFSSLAGRSLTQLRQSAKVGGSKTQSAIRLGAGISK